MFALLLAQTKGPAGVDPADYDPSLDPGVQDALGPLYLFSWLFGCGGWLYTGFLIWMAVSCVRRDPEWYIWLWIIIFVPLGPFIYLLARWIPNAQLQPPKFLRKWTRGRELERLRIAAQQIGNAHQFVEWGDALRETGRLSDAGAAYDKALVKDRRNLQALWGGALVDHEQGRPAAARDKLAQILAIDPAYKFGDVSLLYGKCLCALGEKEQAEKHLSGHTRRWRHPEGLYLLATLYADRGETELARTQLQGMIQDLNGAPRTIVRKQLFWRGRARRMLRKLPQR